MENEQQIINDVTGASHVVLDGAKDVFSSIVTFILNLMDKVTEPFGFKFTDVLNYIADFIKGAFNLFKQIINIFPSPINIILFISFIIFLCLIIYKFISGS